MKQVQYITILFASITILFISCEKDRIEEPNDDKNNPTEYESTDSYFESKQEEQEFEVTNEDGDEPITGKEGTEIYISKNCLEFQNGDTVGFPYTVKLVEIYQPRDIVFWEMPTVSNEKMLSSGGEVRVRAVKDGQELKINGECPVVVNVPSDGPPDVDMELFIVDNFERINWSPNPSTSSSSMDTIATGWEIKLYELGWINVDKFTDPAAHIISYQSDSADLTNVKIFVYSKEVNGMIQVYNSKSYALPDDLVVETFAIAIDADEQLYLFHKSMTLNSDETVEVNLKAVSDAELETYLAGLR